MTEDPTILLERNAGGLHVRLKYLPLTDLVVIEANARDEFRAATVEPSKALDAFAHPCAYLPGAEVFA